MFLSTLPSLLLVNIFWGVIINSSNSFFSSAWSSFDLISTGADGFGGDAGNPFPGAPLPGATLPFWSSS